MKIQPPVLRKARIEIIPMIDTIFFLLVFFMITWLTVVKMNGMPVTLPKPNHAGETAHQSVVLALSRSGRYYLDSHAATAAAWPDQLRERLIAHPNSVVVLNVAPEQTTQTLIDILDRVSGVIAASHTHAQVLVATPRVALSADGRRP